MTLCARNAIADADIILAMHLEKMWAKYAGLLQGKMIYPAGHGICQAVAAGKQAVLLCHGDPTIYAPQTGYLCESYHHV
jgi:precorrin-2 methylase